jgi:hypothetical protein
VERQRVRVEAQRRPVGHLPERVVVRTGASSLARRPQPGAEVLHLAPHPRLRRQLAALAVEQVQGLRRGLGIPQPGVGVGQAPGGLAPLAQRGRRIGVEKAAGRSDRLAPFPGPVELQDARDGILTRRRGEPGASHERDAE